MKSSSRRTAVIRADASATIGGGHVARCMALAARMQDCGWTSVFATRSETLQVFPTLRDQFRTEVLSGDDEPGAMKSATPEGCDLLITDHYARDAHFESACRPWAKAVLTIDDLADRKHDADWLLDQTLGRRSDDYRALVPPSCKMLLGADHALLRPEFAELRQSARPRDAIRTVLITFGATDSLRLASLAIEALRTLAKPITVHVILGFEDQTTREAWQKNPSTLLDVTFHRATPDVARLMVDADLCIGASGVTALERCCLGLPTVVIQTAANQATAAARLAEAGAIIDLGPATGARRDALSQKLTTTLQGLENDPKRIGTMSQAAAGLCDGKGTWRTVLALLPARTLRNGASISFRLATAADAELMFKWQTAPGVRQYSRNPQPPAWNEHLQWLARTLTDPNRLLLIGHVNGQPAGLIRLDNLRGPMEISIVVDPMRRRRGIGRALLRLTQDLVPTRTLRAEIHPENRPSRELFESVDFKATSETVYEFK